MSTAYSFGSFHFDTAAYRLLSGDRPVQLSPKLLDLLRLLTSRASQLVTKEDILRELWPDVAVTDNAITQAVSELRQALGDNPVTPQFVQTVPRRGYRFIAAIKAAPIARAATAPTSPAPARRTIAVADFHNVTADGNDGWMAVGFAETVANDLRLSGDLRVIDRSSLPDSARHGVLEAARAAQLDFLVAGSYQRSGERLRITARIVDVATGEAVARAKTDGVVSDVFQLQDAVVRQLLRTLPVTISAVAARRTGVRETSSLDAYRALTEGKLKLETLDPSQVPAAILDFERAIVLDPRYAQAYVGLAQAHLWDYEASRARNSPDSAALRAAIAYGRRAIELDPELPEAHAALAFLLASAGRTNEALEAGRVAVALDPNEWRHRFRLGVAAWGNERVACFDEVVRVFPEFGYAYFGSAMVYVARRELAVAEEILRQGIAVRERAATTADRFPVNGLHWMLGLIRLAEGDPSAARAQFDRELRSAGSRMYGPEYAMDAYDGHGFACLATGDFAGAMAMFGRALERYPDHARSLIGLSHAHARSGRQATAHAALEHAWRSIDELQRNGRAAEAAMARAFAHVVAGRDGDAIAVLVTLLNDAPPGFVGWTIPIEPLLGNLQSQAGFRAVVSKLADRAS
jgi:DNA-binding winged helix-turn-helix (wHTH) protein/tetratricopeptide (TPR) repeat protein